MANTTRRTDWKLATLSDETADVDGLWNEDAIAVIEEHLLRDDDIQFVEAISEIEESVRAYRAWKVSDLPTKGQVTACLDECRTAARMLRRIMDKMDPESSRILECEAGKDTPTSFDPKEKRARRWPSGPLPALFMVGAIGLGPDDKKPPPPIAPNIGRIRMWQARTVLRRLTKWLDTAVEVNPIERRRTSGTALLVGQLVEIWEECNGRRFTRSAKGKPMDYLVRLSQAIDSELTDDAIDNIAKDYLHSRVVETS